MPTRPRIYLDNAATSWPKPEGVYAAVEQYQRHVGAPGGRGMYREAVEVDEAIQATRAAVASLIGAGAPEQIIFTANGTESLNLAIHGTLKPGDHVVTTVVEHNSVLRPLRWLEDRGKIQVTRVGCDSTGLVDPDNIRKAIRPETRLIALIHASNVTGTIQPAHEVGRIAREHGLLFLLDAAQTLGHIPVFVDDLGVDFLAAPGHKGLLGPSGIGVLFVRAGRQDLLECLKQGGTGSVSFDDRQPSALPYKYESGSQNVSGLLGLAAGIKFLNQRGLNNIRQHVESLTGEFLEGLLAISGATVFGPGAASKQIGVVSIALDGTESPRVAADLDESFGVQARAGFHCAAMLHQSLGTHDTSGTVRFSVGPFNSQRDVLSALNAMSSIAHSNSHSILPVNCPCVASSQPQHTIVPLSPQSLNPATCDGIARVSSPQVTHDAHIPGLQDLWRDTLGDPRVLIAILDGPVDLAHDAFRGSKVESLEPPPEHITAAHDHGTHIASVVFGQHDGPVKGIAPQCRGVVIPIYTAHSDGTIVPCSQENLAKAIQRAVTYAHEHQAEALVINISGGQYSNTGEAHPALADVVRRCHANVLIVASTGNQGCECLHIPGALPSVLAVGAMGRTGEPLEFSNWGEKYLSNGVLALGENVIGASPSGGIAARTGTSYAAPIVSGVASLLLSLQLKQGLTPSVARVRSAIVSSALGCKHKRTNDCRKLLAGRLSITRAVELVRIGVTSPMYQEHQADVANSNTSATGDIANAAAETVNMRENPLGRCATALLENQSERVSPATRVLPSACGCNNASAGVKVFAIGRLSYDFPSASVRESVQRRMKSEAGTIVGDPGCFMRHLFQTNLDGTGKRELNVHEASRARWVLEHAGVPQYVIEPAGLESHSDLKSLIFDYMEQEGLADHNRNLLLAYGSTPLSQSNRPDYFAVPGYTTGKMAVLADTRRVVPILHPEYDLVDTWNLDSVVDDAITRGVIDGADKDRVAEFRMAASALYSYIDPKGDTPHSRAINYIASVSAMFAAETQFSGGRVALKGFSAPIQVESRREDQLIFEVVAHYFDVTNVNNANYSRKYRVDVTEAKPNIDSVSEIGFGASRFL
jgi:cysteine desulfurase/selenocysteine lyase